MELTAVHEHVWVIRGAVNMGLVRTQGDGLVAVDTGLDKQAGKTLEKAAKEIGLPLRAIVNTHAHADHFGGNAYLLSRTPVTVYAPEGEAAVIRRPMFEPEYLWQGASPLPQLQNKFLLAQASPVHVEYTPGVPFEVDGTTFLPVALPGHAAAQCGILVHDVCFAADAYFDPPVVDKHGVPYMVDYLATCRSADSLRSVQAAWFVPGHGEPARRPDAVIDYLKQRHEQAFQTVLAACRHPRSLDELLADVCRARNLAPANPGAYVLLRTPIAAYVTAAVGQGRMEIIMDGGKLQFLTIEK